MDTFSNLGRVLTASFVFLTAFAVAHAKIIYVDDDAVGTDDGSSWRNACVHLQDALADANESAKPVEIRVAQGTYTPDRGVHQTPDDQEATFQLLNGVALRGGYAGWGRPDPNTRDAAYRSVLSGDLQGDDSDTWPLSGNSYHVVTGSGTDETAVLDGFTIERGNPYSTYDDTEMFGCALPGDPRSYGGGMHNTYGSPLVTDCTFIENEGGARGAGMYNLYSHPILLRCTFRQNKYVCDGGAIYNDNSHPTIRNCRFSGNDADYGGAIYNRSSNPSIDDCVFEDNQAFTIRGSFVGSGGAMYNRDSGPVIVDCTFTNNRSLEGGAITSSFGSELVLMRCTFARNEADSDGTSWGGAILNSFGSLVATDCTFLENSASHWGEGGAIWNLAGKVMMTGCTFTANSALDEGEGGAVHNDRGSEALIVDCTFTGNFAEYYGGAIGNYWFDSSLTLVNCLFAGNSLSPDLDSAGAAIGCVGGAHVSARNCTFAFNPSSRGGALALRSSLDFASRPCQAYIENSVLWGGKNQIWSDHDYPDVTVAYSDIQGGWHGAGNIDVDPCFADPGRWDPNGTPDDPNDFWVTGDYHLKSQAGRWDPVARIWVMDDVTSRCIDAGHPRSPSYEPDPDGNRINMGAYGGTDEASKSPEVHAATGPERESAITGPP